MSKTSRYHLLSEGEMLDEEAAMIWGRKDNRPKEISGIALSGGGVRAATVALGVLQCLAEQGLLAKFSYISTVSGGGYIGSALTWFWSKCRLREERLQPGLCQFGCQKSDFPFQDSDLGTIASGGGKYTELSVREKAIRNLAFLGPVDKVDSQISRGVIQDCFLGGGFGTRRPFGYGMADHRGAAAHRTRQEVSARA
ncbi:patatin-like phospholipase family protein (plasmid) [Sinorhizobium medicae]|uniref:patatin-like phospholipase family protein n=1 Tax=Sinorhizobium medicae TaxID=110321 RepID=UPI002AF6BDE5|nr:patatin-like phospholipase family protein [Sinorhizobium medicae]WQO88061.1 patatin-like phospholipase family protein [Sinorhizobium medicae]